MATSKTTKAHVMKNLVKKVRKNVISKMNRKAQSKSPAAKRTARRGK